MAPPSQQTISATVNGQRCLRFHRLTSQIPSVLCFSSRNKLLAFAWRGLAAGLVPLGTELLLGRSHSKWGELLYISGGMSILLFPEATSGVQSSNPGVIFSRERDFFHVSFHTLQLP